MENITLGQVFFLFFANCTGIFGFKEEFFIQRTDLENKTIQLFHSSQLYKIRSVTLCGKYCFGPCHMFSYNYKERVCRLYDGEVSSVIDVTGNELGYVYYRKQGKSSKVCFYIFQYRFKTS